VVHTPTSLALAAGAGFRNGPQHLQNTISMQFSFRQQTSLDEKRIATVAVAAEQ
jgi:hypothetical protein